MSKRPVWQSGVGPLGLSHQPRSHPLVKVITDDSLTSTELADYYPVRDDSEEERINPDTMKRGYAFTLPQQIDEYRCLDFESFVLGRSMLRKRLEDLRAASAMGKRRRIGGGTSNEPSFPLVHFMEKKEAKEDWMNHLAGTTPLRTLATKVPQGLRKEHLLNMLFNYNVPLSRATWFIRIIFLNQTKDKDQRSAVQECSRLWTIECTSFLSTVIEASSDHHVAVQMIRKWQWVLTLISNQWKAGLISRVKFVEWLLDHVQKATDTPLRLRLLLPVCVEYLPSICESRAHAFRLWWQGVHQIQKLSSNTTSAASTSLPIRQSIIDVCTNIVEYIVTAVPHCALWISALPPADRALARYLPPPSPPHVLYRDFGILAPRLIGLLDQIGTSTRPNTNHGTNGSSSSTIGTSAFGFSASARDTVLHFLSSIPMLAEDMILLILTWAVSDTRWYNPYALCIASSIIEEYSATLLDRDIPLQPVLMEFMDGHLPHSHRELYRIVQLMTHLMRANVFSHEAYLRRIIATGAMEMDTKPLPSQQLTSIDLTNSAERHRFYIVQLPIVDATKFERTQRRVALFGISDRSEGRLYHLVLHEVVLYFQHISQRTFLWRDWKTICDDTSPRYQWSPNDIKLAPHLYSYLCSCNSSVAITNATAATNGHTTTVNHNDYDTPTSSSSSSSFLSALSSSSTATLPPVNIITLLRALPFFHASRICDRLARQLQEYLVASTSSRTADKFCREQVTRRVVFVAELLPDYHTLTDLILWLLQHHARDMLCVILPLIRRHYPLLMATSATASRVQHLLAEVARSHVSLNAAEVWLDHAHLPAPLTQSLRDDIMHQASSRWSTKATMTDRGAPAGVTDYMHQIVAPLFVAFASPSIWIMDHLCRNLATHPVRACFEAMIQMCVIQLIHVSRAYVSGELTSDMVRFKLAQLCFVLHEVDTVSNSLGAVSAQRVNCQQLLLGNIHQLTSSLDNSGNGSGTGGADGMMARALESLDAITIATIEKWCHIWLTILMGHHVLHVDVMCRYMVTQIKNGGKIGLVATKLAALVLSDWPDESNHIRTLADPLDHDLLTLIVRSEPIDDIFPVFGAIYTAHANQHGGDGDDPWALSSSSSSSSSSIVIPVSLPYLYYGSALLTHEAFALACLRDPVSLYRHLKKLCTSTSTNGTGHIRAQTLLSRLTRLSQSGVPLSSPHTLVGTVVTTTGTAIIGASVSSTSQPLSSLPSPLLLPSTPPATSAFTLMGPPSLPSSSSLSSSTSIAPPTLPNSVIWRLRRLQPMTLHTGWIHVQLAVDAFDEVKGSSSSSVSSSLSSSGGTPATALFDGEVNSLLATELLFSELCVIGAMDDDDGKRSPVHVPPTHKTGGIVGGLADDAINNLLNGASEVPSLTTGLSVELVSRIARLSGPICRDIATAMISRMNTCMARRVACLHAAELIVNELRPTVTTPTPSSTSVSGVPSSPIASQPSVVPQASPAIAVAEWERISTRYADVAAGLHSDNDSLPYEPPSLCLFMAALAEHDSFSHSQRVTFVDATINQLSSLANALEVNRFAAMEPTTCLTIQRSVMLRFHALESLMTTIVDSIKTVELLLRTILRVLVSPVMHVGHEWYGGVEARVLSSPDSEGQSAFAQGLAFFQFTIDALQWAAIQAQTVPPPAPSNGSGERKKPEDIFFEINKFWTEIAKRRWVPHSLRASVAQCIPSWQTGMDDHGQEELPLTLQIHSSNDTAISSAIDQRPIAAVAGRRIDYWRILEGYPAAALPQIICEGVIAGARR